MKTKFKDFLKLDKEYIDIRDKYRKKKEELDNVRKEMVDEMYQILSVVGEIDVQALNIKFGDDIIIHITKGSSESVYGKRIDFMTDDYEYYEDRDLKGEELYKVYQYVTSDKIKLEVDAKKLGLL